MLLGGGLRSPSAFLVTIFVCEITLSRFMELPNTQNFKLNLCGEAGYD